MITPTRTNRLELQILLLAGCLSLLSDPALTRLNAQTPLQIAQQAYLKASNTETNDYFGVSVAVSGDTVVVGAYEPGFSPSGGGYIAPGPGTAYIFVRNGTNWAQQAYLEASNAEDGDGFGHAVAVSSDTVVVGAGGESSNATGVNDNQGNNSAPGSGAAYVFVRSGTNWSQQAYLKASNTGAGDSFGYSLAVSGDTIVVGALAEDSNATGVNGNQGNDTAVDSGAAYIFVRDGTNWSQQAYLKASNTGAGDLFGEVAVSGDTLVVGASSESSNTTGVNGDQSNNTLTNAGAAYVFVRDGTNWSQQAYLKASNTGAEDFFGWSVTVAGDTLVVGAPLEASNATGVNGNQGNNSAIDSGAAYIFVRDGTNWTQQAYLKASNTGAGDYFAYSLAASGDTVVVGALEESSNATGVNGNQANNDGFSSGAAYVFARSGTNWSQHAYLKASNAGVGDHFGGWYSTATAVSVSGNTLVVGAAQEDSNATGVNGNQNNNSALDSGAAYVFSITSALLPELRLAAMRNGSTLQLLATGTTNTNWRLESRDSLTGTNAWQPLTNLTLGASPTVIQQPLTTSNRFYRGLWVQ